MCQQTEFTRMFTDQRSGFAKQTCSASADHVAFGSRLPRHDKFAPGLALSSRNITSQSPASSSLASCSA